METLKLKREEPGCYTGTHNGQRVYIWKSVGRGSEGGRCVGWNLKLNGRTVADWCASKKEAASLCVRFH
jgi:hypothetical protein